MLGPRATDHIDTVSYDFGSSEESSVLPASSLFHEDHHRGRSVCVGFCIRYIGKFVLLLHFDVDLKAHNSVLSKVLVGFRAGWGLCPGYIFEECIQRSSFDGIPPEHAIGTRQHLSEPKERLTSFIWGMTQLVFKELRSLYDVGANSVNFLVQIDLNFATAATTERISFHVAVEFHDCILVGLSTDVQHKNHLRFEILTNALEEPFVRVDLAIIAMLHSEAQVDPPSFQNIVLKANIPGCDLKHVQ